MIDRNNVRGMLRTLREKHVIRFSPDQDFARKNSVFADFMGIPAATTTATSQYAQWSGAAVVPFFFRRDKGGYRLRIEPPLENFPGGDVQADMQRINDYFSACVRQAPEQYNWVHRRFKTRPPNAPSIYT